MFLWAANALASDLAVHATGVPVYIVIDGQPRGITPVVVHDVSGGSHEVGFRSTALGATAFVERIDLPPSGALDLFVDWGNQTTWTTTSPDEPAAENARPATGDLYLATDPPGARVFLDGQDSGKDTPVLLRGLGAGPHLVEARAECSRGQVQGTIVAGVVNRARLPLRPGAGGIDVTASVEGARLFVDGDEVGPVPTRVEHLACGEHTVQVRAPGFLAAEQRVTVRGWEVTPVSLTLAAETFGELTVVPFPLEAAITIDGVSVGTGPRTLAQVGAGSHSITVDAAGYRAETRQVDVAADVTAAVEVTLRPERRAPSWPRVALDAGVTAGGLVLGSVAAATYARASDAYATYLTTRDDAAAERLFDDEVAPPRTAALVEGIGGALLLAGGVGLWVTTDLALAPAPGGVLLLGRW